MHPGTHKTVRREEFDVDLTPEMKVRRSLEPPKNPDPLKDSANWVRSEARKAWNLHLAIFYVIGTASTIWFLRHYRITFESKDLPAPVVKSAKK